MAKLAERVAAGGRRQTDDDPMDEDKLLRRMNSGANHLRKLAAIADDLDDEDYTAIRDRVLPSVEAWRKAFEKPRSKSGSSTTSGGTKQQS